jgi:glycogen operon protein
VPPELRGTYAGLGHEAAIGHLLDLGVTAVELLPVHESVPESFLVQRGLTNYWGYNTIGYFAPHQAYSAEVRAGRPGGQVAEFKAMTDALHAAGIEVLLDVVFNHTAEGNELGPTFCHRGLDNPAYYRLADDPRYYVDTTGTGNSLNVGDPVTLQLIMDSLRYWLTEMHVDGFRFDLAPALARQEGEFEKRSAFFDLVAQDPVVSRAKLVAEPWDVGQMDSYDLGRFPPAWREWNGKYRDTMRDFWRSHPVGIGEFASRFCGSADLYGRARRRPTASVNLITVHDGFTLRDLVSYNDKHNDANGESNRDGTDDNRSWNCGAEGPTDDPAVLALRARQSRAMLTTLLLSFGVPMLLGGDEMGRTQQGNNNAYCQDNQLTWFDWSAPDTSLLAFTRRLIALRRAHPVFRRSRFLAGAEASELRWFTPAGTEMTAANWADPNALAIALYLDGSDDPDRAADGTPLTDDDFLVLVNAWWQPLDFVLPDTRPQASWQVEIDTYDLASQAGPKAASRRGGDHVTVGPRSVVVLLAPREQPPTIRSEKEKEQ